MLVEPETDARVNPKTEIVAHLLRHCSLWNFDFLPTRTFFHDPPKLSPLLFKSIETRITSFRVTVTSQMSKSRTDASSQRLAIPFRSYNYEPMRDEGAVGPHPSTREKSLPVPKGMIPIGHWFVSIFARTSSSTTHITVPSPPQTMARTRLPKVNCVFSTDNP